MPAVPARTINLGLPRFATDSSSQIWTHLNGIVDWIDGLWGPWKTYTPVWSQSNGSVLNVASGTLEGRYCKLGKMVTVVIHLERAGDSNIGSDKWIFSLPPNLTPVKWNLMGGSCSMVRDDNFFGGAVFPVSSKAVGAIVGDLGRVSNTVPLGDDRHAAGDWYTLTVHYEAA